VTAPVIRVPASSANLGPGFDALGMALSLHLELGFWVEGDGHPIAVEGHPAVVAFRAAGGTGPLWVRSPIPMGRGLGFSGAARVAGLVAAHVQRCGPRLDLGDVGPGLLALATELEGHADNVAASLHGGDRHHEGGYIVYDLVPVAGGWAIDLELRRFDLATGGFARVFKRRLQPCSGPAAVRLQAAG